MEKILVFDLGTTYFKIALINRKGQLLDVCRVAPGMCYTPDGRVELTATAFTLAIAEGLSQLQRREAGCLSTVRAVTFASQTNSFLLLDENAGPLTPILLWPDRRAAAMENELQRCFAIGPFPLLTGIPQVNSQFMAAKLLWVKRRWPDVWKRTRRVCLISDYLAYLLTGRHVTEAGVAGLTGLIDIRHSVWWPPILDRLEIPVQWLPEIARAATDLGPIDARAASRFGLPTACRFVVGCLDQYAGAIGVGNVMPGKVSETTGTVLATVCCTDRFSANGSSAVFHGPAYRDGLYYRMAFGNVSANLLEWYRMQLPDRPAFEHLAALAAGVEPGAAGLRLQMEGGWTCVEEVFGGRTPRHSRGHFVRCIMEAVALALKQQVAVIGEGIVPAEIRSAGGGARSEAWLQIKADMLQVAMTATHCAEPTSLGAAMLAEAALRAAEVVPIAREWVRLKPSHQPALIHDMAQRSAFSSGKGTLE